MRMAGEQATVVRSFYAGVMTQESRQTFGQFLRAWLAANKGAGTGPQSQSDVAKKVDEQDSLVNKAFHDLRNLEYPTYLKYRDSLGLHPAKSFAAYNETIRVIAERRAKGERKARGSKRNQSEALRQTTRQDAG